MLRFIARTDPGILRPVPAARKNTGGLTRRDFFFRTGAAVLLAGTCLSHIACEDSTGNSSSGPSFPADATDGHPPLPTDNAYFAKYSNGNAAYIGLSGFPLGREDARWLGNEPGFSYVDGNVGGTGNTLEIISNTYGMHFEWAYDTLMDTTLFSGWQGKIVTEKGQTNVGLGSPSADFMAAIPGAVRSGGSLIAGIPPNIAFPDYLWYLAADLSGDTISQFRFFMGE